VLQSLAAARLQIQEIMRTEAPAPKLGRRLEAVSAALAAEFEDMRSYIAGLGPDSNGVSAPAIALAPALADLGRRLGVQWGLELETATRGSMPMISQVLFRQISLIIGEAAANAARHGRAGRLAVGITADATKLLLTIANDGAGPEPFGTFTHRELIAGNAGPQSIRHRVVHLGGTLDMTSSASETRLQIVLPRAGSEAANVDAALAG